MNNTSLVILAGGKGTRFQPLTDTTPKPMLPIAGVPVIARNIDSALPYINEIIIVVGHLQEVFREYFGSEYKNKPVIYVEQKEQIGNADALNYVKDVVKNSSILLLYGDDLYSSELFKKLDGKEHATIGKKESHWQSFGVFQLKNGSILEKIVEKPSEFVGDLVNIGMFKLSTDIFKYFGQIQPSSRGELEFTDMLSLYAQDHEVEVIEANEGWYPLSYPWHLLDATEAYLKTIKTQIDGTVEQGATIKGNVIIGKGTIIKAGAYLEGNFYIGEDCEIGPNCYLKGYGSIGNHTNIGNAVEITRSIVGNNVNIKHLSYFGDSIVGNNVNIGGGTLTANFKHNANTIKVMIKEKLTDAGRSKLGTIIGDNARIGARTTMYPGRKIGTGVWTLPGEIIEKDKI